MIQTKEEVAKTIFIVLNLIYTFALFIGGIITAILLLYLAEQNDTLTNAIPSWIKSSIGLFVIVFCTWPAIHQLFYNNEAQHAN